MMVIAPNSLVRQKEGAQGRRRKRGGIEEREVKQTLTPGTDAPTGPTRSGVSGARNWIKHGRCCGVLLQRRARDKCYPLTIEIKELHKDERSW